MNTIPFYLVDVFAENKLEGNQLAVFNNADELNTETMQAIAKETNLAETTFITGKKEGSFDVRIFTTEYEMPFAGHPTIGTAAVISQKIGGNRLLELVLNLKIGPVRVYQKSDLFQFSLKNGAIAKAVQKSEIAKMLGLSESKLGKFPAEISSTGYPFLMVQIADLDTLRRISVAPTDLLVFLQNHKIHKSNSPDNYTVGIFCFCLEAERVENDMHSRMFLLQDTIILEDPATGSAHTAFSYYAHKHEIFGKSFQKRSEQGFEIGRPSILHVAASEDGIVTLGGQVQFIASGIWEI